MTTESFNPLGFLDVAQALASTHNEERYLRTPISRAYYACFHLARLACARKWSWTPPAHGEHRAVVRKLREQRAPMLASQLEGLLRLRETADYYLDVRVDQVLSRRAIETAGWLAGRFQAL